MVSSFDSIVLKSLIPRLWFLSQVVALSFFEFFYPIFKKGKVQENIQIAHTLIFDAGMLL